MDALLSIILVLAAMLAAIYRKASLDATILGGVVLSAALFGALGKIHLYAWSTLTDPKTLELMALIYLVYLLNSLFSAAGTMKRIISAMERSVSDQRVTIMAVPAIIGLMPVPSGAMLSAPFADEIGNKARISQESRHIINYWFRHISEWVNPIYPGVLLAAGILGISFTRLLEANLPVMLFYAACGYAFFVRGMGHGKKGGSRRAGDAAAIALGVLPILTAVVLPVVFKADLLVSLILAILLALVINRRASIDLPSTIATSFKSDLIFLIFEIMLFKTILDQSGATEAIALSLLAAGAPTPLLLIFVPFVFGFLTGLTIGYTGLTFPILLPFLAPGGAPDMGAVTLAFVSGYVGILLSPMHLCFSVTQKYFKTDLGKTYRMLLPPVALTSLFALAYVFVMR